MTGQEELIILWDGSQGTKQLHSDTEWEFPCKFPSTRLEKGSISLTSIFSRHCARPGVYELSVHQVLTDWILKVWINNVKNDFIYFWKDCGLVDSFKKSRAFTTVRLIFSTFGNPSKENHSKYGKGLMTKKSVKSLKHIFVSYWSLYVYIALSPIFNINYQIC